MSQTWSLKEFSCWYLSQDVKQLFPLKHYELNTSDLSLVYNFRIRKNLGEDMEGNEIEVCMDVNEEVSYNSKTVLNNEIIKTTEKKTNN